MDAASVGNSPGGGSWSRAGRLGICRLEAGTPPSVLRRFGLRARTVFMLLLFIFHDSPAVWDWRPVLPRLKHRAVYFLGWAERGGKAGATFLIGQYVGNF